MGIFDTISRTRQLGADILAIEKLSKEIFQELDSLINTLAGANGFIGYRENEKIQNIGTKTNMLLIYSENIGLQFSTVSVLFGSRKMYLPAVIIMIFQTTSDIERKTGCNFKINKEVGK